MKPLLSQLSVISKLSKESLLFAFGSLKGDKFRTFLSLFGVTVGIFSIVMVFTAIDALKANVDRGLQAFGSSTVYVQQFPFGPDESGEYRWWEFNARPLPKIEEFNYLVANSSTSSAAAFVTFSSIKMKYKRNSFTGGFLIGHTYDWNKISNTVIDQGRYFTSAEATSSSSVCILGYAVADNLFHGEDPINKIIKLGGSSARVVGVLKKEGESIVSIFDSDNSVWVPYHYAGSLFNVKRSSSMICITPKEGVERDEFIEDIRHLLRSFRRLKPSHKDNFAINEMSFLLSTTKEIFKGISLAGWVIGGFSILIGGFGIANIMFVSVKERTNLIGIQKALGAKKFTILTQFLTEAITLSVVGGILGILLTYLVILTVGSNDSFPMYLSLYNIIKGLSISSVIGVLSGYIPAYTASNLNPVDAINYR